MLKHSSVIDIEGFRVLPIAPVSSAFKIALTRIRKRGWDDPSCTIIKTPSGAYSAITHSGGRCMHDLHPQKKEVLDMMIEQGIEPPTLPFVIAPGEITLYHEWGHFVDLRCSNEETAPFGFSYNWFSQYYRLHSKFHNLKDLTIDQQIIFMAAIWEYASSELFAELFEDWLRRKRKTWEMDVTTPEYLTQWRCKVSLLADSKIDLKPGITTEQVRSETYTLFEAGAKKSAPSTTLNHSLFPKIHRATMLYGEIRKGLAEGDPSKFLTHLKAESKAQGEKEQKN